MSKPKKRTPLLASVLAGGVLALLLAVAISFFIAWIISKEWLPQSIISSAPPFLIGAAVFIAVLIVQHNVTKEQKLLAAVGTGAAYLLLCFIVKLILFPGNYAHFLRNVLVILFAVLVGFFMSAKKKKHTNFHREKWHR